MITSRAPHPVHQQLATDNMLHSAKSHLSWPVYTVKHGIVKVVQIFQQHSCCSVDQVNNIDTDSV